MKIAIINGSPRKTGNTATLLKECQRGAQEAGATCDLLNLYSLDYKGCTSCFQCKRIDGKSYGVRAMQDELTPFLSQLESYDGLIIGSPMYFGSETGETRSFIERTLFPYLTYTPDYGSIFPKKIPTAMLYTMGVKEENLEAMGYPAVMERARSYIARILGTCELFYSTDTWQFSDYSKYLSTAFDPEAKAQRRAEVFPEDCRKAAELGARIVSLAK